MMCLLTGCAKYVEDGTAFLQEGKYDEAIAEFEKAVEDETDLGEAYRGIGIAYFEKEDYAAAVEAFSNALSNKTEKTPTIYNMMGICEMKLDNVDNALNNFRIGISVAEETKGAYDEVLQEMEYNEVVCYERQLDWASAKTQIADYLSKYPDDVNAQKEAEFLETR